MRIFTIMKQIIILQKGDEIEVWGSLTEICKNHSEFSYYTLRNKKFPFTYKGVKFYKITYRERKF
jgi:hypothetical protein